jgi:hypothetical protein
VVRTAACFSYAQRMRPIAQTASAGSHRLLAYGLVVFGVCMSIALTMWFGREVEPTPNNPYPASNTADEPTTAKSSPRRDTNRTRPQSDAEQVAINGRVLWSDGTPAANVEVTVDADNSKPAITKLDGTYSVPIPTHGITGDGDTRAVAVHLLPPCWVDAPHATETQLTKANTESFHADDIKLPNRIDVLVTVELDDYIYEQLRDSGYGRLMAIGSDPTTRFLQQLGRTWVALRPGSSSAVLHARHSSTISLGLAAWPPDQHTNLRTITLAIPKTVALDRNKLSKVQLTLDGRSVLAGVVVDHLDRPIPFAALYFEIPDASREDGQREEYMRSDKHGGFRYYAEPGINMTAVAERFKSKSEPVSVVVGNHDYRLQIDMSSHARLRLVQGTTPIRQFSCEQRVRLFGTQHPPTLSVHSQGLAWLPKPTQGRPLYLTWMDGTGIHEQPLGSEPQPGAITTLDVRSLPETPLGTVTVTGLDAWPRHYVQIMLLEPLPALPQGGRSAGFMEFSDARFLGVPAGNYNLKVQQIRKGGRDEVLNTKLVLGGRDQTLNIAELVRR